MMKLFTSAAVLLVSAPAFAGAISIGEVTPAGGSLSAQLAREVSVAKKKSLRPFVEVSAVWCRPCQAVAKSLSDPLMIAAFAGVHLVRVDLDAFSVPDLTSAGIAATSVPTFYELDASGKPTGRTLGGDAWAEDVPKNMAPPLRAFFNRKP